MGRVIERVDDRNRVARRTLVRRIIYIIAIVLIDYRRSDTEGVKHVIRIIPPDRLVHSIIDDLEKIRILGWQRVELVDICPMTVVIGISVPSTRLKGSEDPLQAEEQLEIVKPLQAVGVTNAVITGPLLRIR